MQADPWPPFILAALIGGIMAGLFARRHPDQVAGLIFVDAVHPDAGGTGLSRQDGRAARCCRSIPSGYADCAPVSPSTNDHVLRSHARTSNDGGELAATPPLAPDVALVGLAHERPDRLLSPRFAAAARLSEALLAGGSCRGSDHLIGASQPHAMARAVLEIVAEVRRER